jgi:hypothetical protein
MCLILAIVVVVFISLPSRRSVYGDQGQEVSRKVRQERFVAKREQDQKGKEVEQYEIRVVPRCIESVAWRSVGSLGIGEPELREHEPRSRQQQAQLDHVRYLA